MNGDARQYIDNEGYRRIKMGGHPREDNRGYVKEHILIAERIFGRPISSSEIIHHIDLAKGLFNPFGLVICPGEREHRSLHIQAKALLESGDKDKRTCYFCKKYDDVAHLYKSKSGGYRHVSCNSEYNRQLKKLKGLQNTSMRSKP